MSDPSARWHGRPWWQFVGVLVAVAALVVAVLQLVSTPPSTPPAAAPPAAVTAGATTAPVTPTTPPAAPSPSAAAPAEGTERWRGPITFTEEFATSTDLDQKSPRTTDIDADGDIQAGGVSSMLDTKGPVTDYDRSSRIAEWTDGGTPTFADCKDRALAGGGKEVADVRKGTVLCVLTDKGNIARLTITKVIKFAGFDADTVVWNANAG
ncbi:hypothetical protein [Actinoplanes sp. NPDC049265]|uniref:hypothetical protein n=1 Tax=Actinoplanes sp. NPDC049265 TaxID=3363902 RepID=UPI00371BD624